MELFELADRWLHFGAGVLWIGLLYFFNWVNSAFAPTLDAETKRKVVPELLPRALYWFRWGAAVTWVTGFFLLFLVYYHGYDGAYLLEDQRAEIQAKDWLPGFLGLFVGFLVYDALFKVMARQHNLAVLIWAALTMGFAYFLRETSGFSMRATYIHVAAMFGTAMAANVWMRIWPAQKRIIRAIKNGEAPDPTDPAIAGLRSKHNTYMSVPLLLFMVSVHQPAILSISEWYYVLPVVLVVSFLVTKALYAKAKSIPGF